MDENSHNPEEQTLACIEHLFCFFFSFFQTLTLFLSKFLQGMQHGLHFMDRELDLERLGILPEVAQLEGSVFAVFLILKPLLCP